MIYVYSIWVRSLIGSSLGEVSYHSRTVGNVSFTAFVVSELKVSFSAKKTIILLSFY